MKHANSTVDKKPNDETIQKIYRAKLSLLLLCTPMTHRWLTTSVSSLRHVSDSWYLQYGKISWIDTPWSGFITPWRNPSLIAILVSSTILIIFVALVNYFEMTFYRLNDKHYSTTFSKFTQQFTQWFSLFVNKFYCLY